ncbi:MAG: aspartyl protease family protein [Verrucomicrobiota bacterium]|nr:aspartyl protease family protein [Verrucomicrobiota bacterium]
MNRHRTGPDACFFFALTIALLTAGCSLFRRVPVPPGRTRLESKLVELPAQMISNYLIVESHEDKYGPYHFIIDTGASVTLVSPELARRYPDTSAPQVPAPQVRVQSAGGDVTLLPSVTLRRIFLGAARFERVPALVYDCSALSAHLGIKIDGVLGFPLFRDTLLTLDYPHSRVLLMPADSSPTSLPGSTISFNNGRRTPLIPVTLGDETFIALIDSGSDGPLSLNPVGLHPSFAFGPRDGAAVATLTGDRPQQVGRVSQSLHIGDYTLLRPVLTLTDELSSLGGAILKNFTVTFDQQDNRVTFFRPTSAPILTPSKRSAGLSFDKTPAYWRVVSVVPGSPADALVQPGDLCTRINGQPVKSWNLRRYLELVAKAEKINFTFLRGTHEEDVSVNVFDLVP